MDLIDSILATTTTDNVWEQPNQTHTTKRDGSVESDWFTTEPE